MNPIEEGNIYEWFQLDATKTEDCPLNHLSGWETSDKIFNETIEDWVQNMNPPLRPGESVFEMGCGVGAVLVYISKLHDDLTISGSDFSINAINKIKSLFVGCNFYCQNITSSHPVLTNSQDHVISAGALAMYLYKNEMCIAIKEAVRMTKPGGSLGFTHFLENKGKYRRSIVEKVDKQYWLDNQDELGIENISFFTIKHQHDRYGFVCNKKK